MTADPTAQSLAGIRVVALEQAVAMPFCSWMLAELGAEVVKIERPGQGDVLRGWDSVVRGLSSGFVALNANKRDVTVDLSCEDGRAVVHRLVATADVFVENFAPGVADRLGFGAAELRARHPRLVYCSLSGYGHTGPYRDVKAYDLMIQGEAGLLLTNGTTDQPAKVGIPVADLVGGVTAALAVVAGLRLRDQRGAGVAVDLGMFECMLPWLTYYAHHWWHGGAEPPRSGMRHQYLTPYGPFLAADGRYVNVVVASPQHWKAFCESVVERPEWLTDPRFSDLDARKANRDALERLVEEEISSRPSTLWLERLRAAQLPAGEVRTIAEVVEHPQTLDRQMVVEAGSPVGAVPLLRSPLGDRNASRRVPALGEDTDAVLTELGYDVDEIARLRGRGVV